MKHKIFVYGSLRPGKSETVTVPGQMFALGWFPGAVNINENEVDDQPHFVAEVIEVDDEMLARLDQYEGYDPRHPEHSLYVRKKYKDGFIYQYNGNVNGRLPVPTNLAGACDWLEYTQMKEGCNASVHSRR